MKMETLRSDITKILIYSNFYALAGAGDSATEINSFHERAINFYNDRGHLDPEQIRFYSQIDRDVALIMDIISKKGKR